MHLIDAEMVTLDLHDTLVIDAQGDHLEIVGGSSDVPVGPNNLVNRALALTQRTAGVVLSKRIPSQAGLGGGSSDAGAILRWAGFDDVVAAASIGADVAFCLVGGRARVLGIGDVIEPLAFRSETFTLVTPPVACSTPDVYRAWDDLGAPTSDSGNDLEPAALLVAPELVTWRDELWEAAGTRPMLAGSGSTWFVRGSYPGRGRTVVETTPAGWEPSG
jgi:4-diphosphocytidyl-2-C-methyl-D-erythritol kinase